MPFEHTHRLRVRYSEIDAMGTYYNSRALDWFECGRTELCRAAGKPYTQWEAEGVSGPLIEAHVVYQGPAAYDDELAVTASAKMVGRARMRFDVRIENVTTGKPVCHGYTVHAVTDPTGRPIRPPQWLLEVFEQE